MPATHKQFSPAANVVIQATSIPANLPIPAVDAANVATVLTNLSGSMVAIVAGAVPGQVINLMGSVSLAPGQSVLHMGFGAAANATVQALSNATVSITRGTVMDAWLFPNPALVG